MLPIVLDCDPGHDDAIALLYAARRARLLAVTTVFGNGSVADTTRNALRICELGGIDVPVAAGSAGSLLGRDAPAGFHGGSGLDGAASLPEPARAPVAAHAASLLIETARAAPGEVALVATGPLTNVALALRLEPRLAQWLRCISVMGGSLDIGNATPHAETNVFRDPEAADIVFRSGAHVLMAGLNLTRRAMLDRATAARLRATGRRVACVVADMLDYYLGRYEQRGGVAAAPMHDPTAVLALLRPELVTHRRLPVAVQREGRLRGMTAADLRGFAGEAAADTEAGEIEVGTDMDGARAIDAVVDAIAEY
jgi:purine nucleosidase